MSTIKAPRSLRFEVAINSIESELDRNPGRKVVKSAGLKAALISASCVTLGILAPTDAWTQTTTAQQGRGASQLPPVQVTAPEERHRANSAPAQRADRGGQRRRAQAARRPPQSEPAPKAFTRITGCAHRHRRRLRQQHIGGDQDQHAAGQHSAVGHRRDQGFHPRPEFSDPHRRHPLRPLALPSTRARATATSSSSAASTPAPISTSTAFAMTSSISAISTTRRASKS